MRTFIFTFAFLAIAQSASVFSIERNTASVRAARGQIVRVDLQSSEYGVLQKIDQRGTLTFNRVSGTKDLPKNGVTKTFQIAPKDFLRFGNLKNPAHGPQLLFSDGSVLVGDPVRIDLRFLIFDADLLGRVSIPRKLIRGILLNVPKDERGRSLLCDQIISSRLSNDRVVFINRDATNGHITEINDLSVTITSRLGKINIPLKRVSMIAFGEKVKKVPNESKPEKTTDNPPRWVVGLSDGTRLYAQSIPSKDRSLLITSNNRDTIKARIDDVVYLQSLRGRFVFVSDLQPTKYRHAPFLSLKWPYWRDRNVTGGPLICGAAASLKGLGMHSKSQITYKTEKRYRKLIGQIAIDDQTHGRGSVVFRVYLFKRTTLDANDNSTVKKGRWEEKPVFTSQIIRGDTPAVRIEVDVSGAEQIGLVVDYADRGDEMDHANWLNLRLVE